MNSELLCKRQSYLEDRLRALLEQTQALQQTSYRICTVIHLNVDMGPIQQRLR